MKHLIPSHELRVGRFLIPQSLWEPAPESVGHPAPLLVASLGKSQDSVGCVSHSMLHFLPEGVSLEFAVQANRFVLLYRMLDGYPGYPNSVPLHVISELTRLMNEIREVKSR